MVMGNYDNTLELHITNVGLGPAVIKSFNVSLDGEEIKEKDKMDSLMRSIFNGALLSADTYEIDHTCVLASNEKRELTKARVDKGKMAPNTNITHILSSPSYNRIKFLVKYESLYGKQFTLEDSFI